MVERKIAVVTGAASGLGKEIAIQLANAGSTIIVADVDREQGLKLEKELKKKAKEAFYVHVNVLDEESVKIMVEKSLDKYGGVDILVNCAGITQREPLEKISIDDWNLMLNVNLRGPYLCTKHVLPVMKKQHFGRVVNVSSIAAMSGGGFVGTSHYAASKAGIVGFTKATAKESGEYGITANVVAPGPCRTRLSSSWVDEHEAQVANTIPIQRIGEPEDIANTVLFLASAKSNFITGETIAVDGGITTVGLVQK
ncbi:SDR family NAD(P)-dependent oxidoreductase [Natribacillus halophilus]|uniref:3-oxoacyl-[acyl-carrier protein] reductase n=1 Tax=Natribacillus halophilus TaxID=549003 RepID=A0A1G8PAX2_9BACI|nr:glucose 1-dehydrogenase [Natribacillus halophilus]SDI89612.1 3-oxoacyl-[acyl-carrier protein] reductase [Natribacillus halophilus]